MIDLLPALALDARWFEVSLVGDALLDKCSKYDDTNMIAALLISVQKDDRGKGGHGQGQWSPLVSEEGGSECSLALRCSCSWVCSPKIGSRNPNTIPIQMIITS